MILVVKYLHMIIPWKILNQKEGEQYNNNLTRKGQTAWVAAALGQFKIEKCPSSPYKFQSLKSIGINAHV